MHEILFATCRGAVYFDIYGGHAEVPMSDPLRKRAFERAAEILGGDERLAAYLRADMEEIRRWRDLPAPPPERVLQSLSRVLRDELIRKSKRVSKRR
jgi:hypothetical protein